MIKTKFWFVFVLSAALLLGVGCGTKNNNTEMGEDQTRTVALTGDYVVTYPENYTLSKVNGADRLSDGECLIYLQGEANTLLADQWDKQQNTQRIGELDYNMTVYREAGRQVRSDAHLIGTDVKLSLDNPAGWQRCVDDYHELLSAVRQK